MIRLRSLRGEEVWGEGRGVLIVKIRGERDRLGGRLRITEIRFSRGKLARQTQVSGVGRSLASPVGGWAATSRNRFSGLPI